MSTLRSIAANDAAAFLVSRLAGTPEDCVGPSDGDPPELLAQTLAGSVVVGFAVAGDVGTLSRAAIIYADSLRDPDYAAAVWCHVAAREAA